MRIVYSHRINSHDGQGVHVEELIRALRTEGHEVIVVGPRFYNDTDFGGESRLVAVARRLLPGVLSEIAELAYNIPAYRRLKAAWLREKPDFIYERCNLYFLAGAWLARRHGARLFLEVNSPPNAQNTAACASPAWPSAWKSPPGAAPSACCRSPGYWPTSWSKTASIQTGSR
jgi:hypothetical protein